MLYNKASSVDNDTDSAEKKSIDRFNDVLKNIMSHEGKYSGDWENPNFDSNETLYSSVLN